MNPKYWTTIIVCNIFSVLGFAQTETSGGTVILIYGDSTHVVVAADSRLTNNNSIALSDSECKITAFGHNNVFVSAGVYYAPLGFNIHKIAKLCYDSIPDIEQRTFAFFGEAASSVSEFMDTIRSRDTTMFNSTLPHTAIEFAWIASDEKQISVFWYSITPPRFKGKGKQSTTAGDGGRWRSSYHNALWHPLGISGFNKQCMNADAAQTFLQTYGDTSGMTRLIQVDIGLAHQLVGGKIDILTIDKGGIHWQVRKRECQECEACPKK
jgi:hypothetical protein